MKHFESGRKPQQTAGSSRSGDAGGGPPGLVVLGVAAWYGLGAGRRGQIGDAVQTVSDGARDASTNVQGKVAEARTSARNAGLEQKVSARLHGDKSLGAEKIEVTVLEEGTATLKGQVPDAAAKEKAVALTRDTRGVLRRGGPPGHPAAPPGLRRLATPSPTRSRGRHEAPKLAMTAPIARDDRAFGRRDLGRPLERRMPLDETARA